MSAATILFGTFTHFILNKPPPHYILEDWDFNFRFVSLIWFRYSWRKMAKLFANSRDPDQMLHLAASGLGLHCLPVYPFGGLQTKIG